MGVNMLEVDEIIATKVDGRRRPSPFRKPIIDGKKQCATCKQWKILTEFGPSKRSASGYDSLCMRCANLRRLYKISSQEYDLMVDNQNGLCALCGNVPNKQLCVDHDHISGKIRGLLCYRCNNMLGHVNDDINLLQKAIEYLVRYNEQVVLADE
jgi:hypothetical protein